MNFINEKQETYKMKKVKFFAAAAFAAGLAGCSFAGDEASTNAVLESDSAKEPVSVSAEGGVSAVIDGTIKIETSEVDELVNLMTKSISQSMPGFVLQPEQLVQLRDSALKQLVTAALLDRECDKEGVSVTDAEVLDFLKENAGPDVSFESLAQRMGQDVASVKEMVTRDVRFKKLIEKNVKTPEISDDDVKARFDEIIAQDPSAATNQPSVTASHILVKVEEGEDDAEAKKKIDGLYDQLVNGADFGKLAEENSDCPSGKASKGSLGRFGRGQMVKEFEDAAFSQEIGKVGKPVKTQFGWHLILVESRDEGGPVKFEDVKEMLKSGMTAEATRRAQMEFMQKIEDSAKIEILEKTVVSEPVKAEPAPSESGEEEPSPEPRELPGWAR